MAQNKTLEQLIEDFIRRLAQEKSGSISVGEANQWATGILDAYKAEHGNGGDPRQ